MCAGYDELRDEGMDYAARLAAAGVSVESRCWDGQFHGSQSMAKLIPAETAEYHEQIVRALRGSYGTA
jgi:acetyl esterase